MSNTIDPIPSDPKTIATAKAAIEAFKKVSLAVVTLAAEVAVVAFIGSSIGSYLSANAIVADCQRVNIAKVGAVYINCTVVEPKKDAPTAAPR